MATVRDYMDTMRQRQMIIARKLGVDLAGMDPQTRVLNLSLLALLAVLIKTLIDAGVITGAQLNAVLDTARDDSWWSEPVNPVDPRGS